MTAIVHVPTVEQELFEQEISATFENGGGLSITARGDCLYDCLETILNLVDTVILDRDRSIDLTLRYWHLTEDLESVEVEALVSKIEDYSTPQGIMMKRMVTEAMTNFLKKLSRHQIVLRGEGGGL
jgi:hypothetical protein